MKLKTLAQELLLLNPNDLDREVYIQSNIDGERIALDIAYLKPFADDAECQSPILLVLGDITMA